MRKFSLFFYVFLVFVFVTSCTKDSDLQPLNKTETLVRYHYNSKSYDLRFIEDDQGNSKLITELPSVIKNLEYKENLVTVIGDHNIYFFDDEKKYHEFYGFSQEEAFGLNENVNTKSGIAFDVNLFNYEVRAYEHDYFTGRKLNITRGYDLRNLTQVNFNDIMSSIAIDTRYQNPWHGDVVELFEHKDFDGRRLTFIDETLSLFTYDGGVSGRQYRGHHKFRNLFLPWSLRRWADKVSSINVKFGGVSQVPPYPSSGGGGGGISQPGDDPIK